MDNQAKFLLCKHCGNLVNMIEDAGIKILCCGEPMQELEANTSDGAFEKHLPVVDAQYNQVIVKVGSIFHPQTEEHFIAWVCLVTTQGGQFKRIPMHCNPQVEFSLTEDERVLCAYAYCNLHGLWKTEIK